MAFERLDRFLALAGCCEGLELSLRELDVRMRGSWEDGWPWLFVVTIDERGVAVKGAAVTNKNDGTRRKAASGR